MQNSYVESFNGRMRDEVLNESLFFGIAHAHSAIAEWRQDFNTADRIPRSDTRPRRPLSELSPQPAPTLRSRLHRLLSPHPTA